MVEIPEKLKADDPKILLTFLDWLFFRRYDGQWKTSENRNVFAL